MIAVHFFDNKNLLLTQLRERVPDEGEDLKIKGRKCKVTKIIPIQENIVHVQVFLEPVKQRKSPVAETQKKRRR
jgi:hypothetical protein